jgi:hypothetical protein
MGVYELSGAGSLKTGRTLYTSMNAGNQYGAMVPIASVTSPAGNIFFNNIPAIYQDLMVVMYVRDSTAATTSGQFGGFNGEFGANTNYSFTNVRGDGTSASSARVTNQPYIAADGQWPAASSPTGTFGATIWHILNYANTTTFKTYINRSAYDYNGAGSTYLSVGLWRNTAAINQVIIAAAGTFVAGSMFTLYGIRAVSS